MNLPDPAFIQNPEVCPYCGYSDLSETLIHDKDTHITAKVVCHHCHNVWDENFTYTGRSL